MQQVLRIVAPRRSIVSLHNGSLRWKSCCSTRRRTPTLPRWQQKRTIADWVRKADVPGEEDDTIYALSSANGRAAIAVIRVSGSKSLDILKALCPGRPLPKPRVAAVRKIYDPNNTEIVIDSGALVLHFAAPKTVTGEDLVEFHVHGGPAIVRSLLEAIPRSVKSNGNKIRAAEAGEFTKRAFYNGRLDLTEVEALGESLAADTEQQRRLAISGASNDLAKRYTQWRKMLLYARGELEALIDFSEDQHFDESPADFIASVSGQIQDLMKKLDVHLSNASKGELLRNGINVALLGVPNAGKSSLLNRIVGREAAIVSAEEGTTRDIVDVSVDVGGWLVHLGDMAGLRQQIGEAEGLSSFPQVGAIEREGIRRARERALNSDLVIVLVSFKFDTSAKLVLDINNELIDAVRDCQRNGKNFLTILNKVDLLHQQSQSKRRSLSSYLDELITIFPHVSPHEVFCVSCKDASSGESAEPDFGGIQTLLAGLQSKFANMTAVATGLSEEKISTSNIDTMSLRNYWSASLNITHRQSQHLRDCLDQLHMFLEVAGVQPVIQSNLNRALSNFYVDGHDDIIAQHVEQKEHRHDMFFDTETSSTSVASQNKTFTKPPPLHVELEDGDIDIVAAAERLRYAADSLAKLTGTTDEASIGSDVEDVLGVVFEK